MQIRAINDNSQKGGDGDRDLFFFLSFFFYYFIFSVDGGGAGGEGYDPTGRKSSIASRLMVNFSLLCVRFTTYFPENWLQRSCIFKAVFKANIYIIHQL